MQGFKQNIAVLISDKTASSGEMTAISLLARENSKTFGNKTAGYTTANAMYKLSNGATLLLAVSYSMDKIIKKIYRWELIQRYGLKKMRIY